MCYPSIQALVAEEVQVCAYHVGLCVRSFFVCYYAVKVPPVIVAKRLVVPASGQRERQGENFEKKEKAAYPGSWKYLSTSSSSLFVASTFFGPKGSRSELDLKDGAAIHRPNSVAEAMATAHIDSRIMEFESRRAEQVAKNRNQYEM